MISTDNILKICETKFLLNDIRYFGNTNPRKRSKPPVAKLYK